MTRLRRASAPGCAVLIISLAAPAAGNPASEALRAKAANHTYNLEHDLAAATFREAVAADPADAGAYRDIASSFWLSITFSRCNMTVDDYLGRPMKPNEMPTSAWADTGFATASTAKNKSAPRTALANVRIASVLLHTAPKRNPARPRGPRRARACT